jgi:hypothetical protein
MFPTDCPLTPVHGYGILEPIYGARAPLEKTSHEKAIFSGKRIVGGLMSLSDLDHTHKRVLIFGGKGG